MDGGTLSLSFEPGSDMSLLFIEVNEKLDRCMAALPKDMQRPKVMKMGALDIPAFYVNVTGGDFAQTSRLVRTVVSKRIEQLAEVAMVDVSGTVGTQITVQPDAGKMASLGLTTDDIERTISNGNIVLEALSVREGIYRYTIHFDAQLLTMDDIANLYVRHEGRLLQLRDFCRFSEETAVRGGIVRSSGEDAVTMAVIKQDDARMADLQKSVAEVVADMETAYPQLHFEVTRDQTELLGYSIDNLEWNLVLGGVMASLVLFLFIGGWRLPLLVIISIPLSLILTLLAFYLVGISLNVVSLSGLILGMGMIVDNSIIVIDNIQQRRRRESEDVVEATREVFMPMLSSVLTTCSVFVPLIFLSGTAGAMFYDQAMGVSFALFASLFVAAMVVPVYYFAFCRKGVKTETRLTRSVNTWMMDWYCRVLRVTLRRAGRSVAFFVGCLALTFVLLPFVKKERMPAIAHDDTLLYIDWNEGISAEENDRRLQDMLATVKSSTVATTTMAGTQDFMLPHTRDLTGGEAVCYVKARSAASIDSVCQVLSAYVAQRYPQAKMEYSVAASVFDLLFSTNQPDLSVRLRGSDRPSLDIARALTDSLRRLYPSLGIQPLATEEVVSYEVSPERAAFYGVNFSMLQARLKELVGSGSVYEIGGGGERVPVVVGDGARDTRTLLDATVTRSDGTAIPLQLLLTARRTQDFKRLTTDADGAYVAIDIDKATDAEVASVQQTVQRLTDGTKVKAAFHGAYYDSRSMVGELAVVLAVALFLLYFILAAQFESLVQPCVILAEVVIDVAIVLLALWLTGESLNLMSMIGLVVMCGVIVNDSILKVDTINRLWRGGMPLLRSVVTAGHQRLRPIVMTSLTTILAIVPFLHRGDMGSDLQFPLSLTLIVGMTVGTLVSLFFVPLVYFLIYKRKR